jgi:hypothetical protein
LAHYAYTGFSRPVRKDGVTYREWPTDASPLQGFNAWFDNVLMRAYADADAANVETSYPALALQSFETNLDYAYDHYLRSGMLPINLLNGWNDGNKTKGFHQASFASEYALLAIWRYRQAQSSSISLHRQDLPSCDHIYTLSGQPACGTPDSLPGGIYIIQGRKVALK